MVDICRVAKRRGKYPPLSPTLRCFSIYHTSWIASGSKSNFIWENIATKAIWLCFGCSEVNSTWLITSELANQRARKVLFTCVVYTKNNYFLLAITSRCSGNKPALLPQRHVQVGAFEQLFGPERGRFEQKFPKFQLPGSCRGGGWGVVKALIWLVHK